MWLLDSGKEDVFDTEKCRGVLFSFFWLGACWRLRRKASVWGWVAGKVGWCLRRRRQYGEGLLGKFGSACGAGTNCSKFPGRICGLGKKTASEPEDAQKAKNKRNGKHCFGTILKFLISVPKIRYKNEKNQREVPNWKIRIGTISSLCSRFAQKEISDVEWAKYR